ncbi:conserved Plasmodium protein, unknown function [Plasmodium gallinaceum]|uniref:Uncharacterized protein n=1 Tax=Plasmodium gallinaceum TaxID=5849 RepID=A0A1J1GVF5_PLAGA|nr:conserved Plasmodium protein, unknown function [Plasmodium gallinaceum]CRG95027.1 conserved Plasmodium protein, unknown function [Plasmodium gallinaceum]
MNNFLAKIIFLIYIICIANVSIIKIAITDCKKLKKINYKNYYKNHYKYNYNNKKNIFLRIKNPFFSIQKLKTNRNLHSFINIKSWKEDLKHFLHKYGIYNNQNIHPLKNCLWEITIYNFFLQKQKSFFIYIFEDGNLKTSENLYGKWSYNNYYITWYIEEKNKKVYYTAELLWNYENSKMVKGIIYEEKKKTSSFLPSSIFRKIIGSFEGKINS